MKRMIISWICLLAMAASLAGCSQEAAEEATTTLTGIVTAVEGTVITVQEMGSGRTNRVQPEGERPSMPQGGFSGTLPEGATLPESGFDGTYASRVFPRRKRPGRIVIFGQHLPFCAS